MIIIYILVGLVVIIFWFKLTVVANTATLNNLRRPDGSYADYDFPGILNGSNPAEAHRKARDPHQNSHSAEYDLYGRPLPPDVIERRKGEAAPAKQIVYVLRHTIHEDAEPKLLGIYESLDSAKAAIERFQQLEGFAEYPEGFQLDEYELDRDHGGSGLKDA